MADLREQCLAAWTERRADESRAACSTLPSFLANPYRYSQDGKCVACGGDLALIARQHDARQRDWAQCKACEYQQGVVMGRL